MSLAQRRLGRRQFLAGLAGLVGAVSSPLGTSWLDSRVARGEPSPSAPAGALSLKHLAWMWNFTADGSPESIRSVLAAHNLAIAVKTHDGVDWMAQYDKSAHAITGPPQVETLARFFEDAGVPFHSWSLVKGRNPVQEARMAAAVLDAGARSMVLDLEPHSGFWEGTPEGALAFGAEFRRLQPNAWLVVSYDPRPWVVERVPLKEFASFSNEFAPQLYWETFNNLPNLERFIAKGSRFGPEGITPQFLLDLTLETVRPYGLPVQPIGQGAATTMAEWQAFLDHSFQQGIESVGVWRYGVTDQQIWRLLRDQSPQPKVYVVQPGDSLSQLADNWNTSVQAIADLNGIENPNHIRIGQQLSVPRRGFPVGRGVKAAAVPTQSSFYIVQPGDTLTGIAQRSHSTVTAIANLNNITDTDFIAIGQRLRIP